MILTDNNIIDKFSEVFGKIPTVIQSWRIFEYIILDDSIEIDKIIEVNNGESIPKYNLTLNDYVYKEPYEPEPWESNPPEFSTEPITTGYFYSIERAIMAACLLIDEEYGRDNEVYSIYEQIKDILR